MTASRDGDRNPHAEMALIIAERSTGTADAQLGTLYATLAVAEELRRTREEAAGYRRSHLRGLLEQARDEADRGNSGSAADLVQEVLRGWVTP